MKTKLLVSALGILSVFASPARSFATSDDAAGAAGCFACGTTLIVLLVAVLVINIAILVWVARDAKARSLDNSILWMLLVFFLGIFGLIIYLLARPKGIVVPCPNCKNKRLQASMKCPHCGFGAA